MKTCILFFFGMMLFLESGAQGNVYDLKFPELDGKEISMSSYQGKKIIVAVCNTAASVLPRLKAFENWYHNNRDKYALIVIPISDLDAGAQKLNFGKQLLDTLKPEFALTSPAYGKKSDASMQHQLLQWLTDKNKNQHFDNDVETPVQMFVINERGGLYAVMENTTDLESDLFRKVINTKP